MISDIKFKKLISVYLILALVLSGIVILFNYNTNPYGVFKHSVFDGYKSIANRHVRTASAWQIKHQPYQGIVIGSSRVNMGVDATSEYFPGNPDAWFNLALPGISLEEMYLYLEHAINNLDLKYILIGLDEYLFDENPRQYRVDFSKDRLDLSDSEYIALLRYKSDIGKALFSVDAIRDGITSLLNPELKYQKGFWVINRDSHTHKKIINGFTTVKSEAETNLHKMSAEREDVFKQLLDLLYAHPEIRVDLYLHPEHQIISQARLRNYDLMTFVNRIKQLINQSAEKHHQPPYQLWNFKTESPVTTVDLDDFERVKSYYYEGTHYTSAVGDMIACHIYQADCSDSLLESQP